MPRTLYIRHGSDDVAERLDWLANRARLPLSTVALCELSETARRADNEDLLNALPSAPIDHGPTAGAAPSCQPPALAMGLGAARHPHHLRLSSRGLGRSTWSHTPHRQQPCCPRTWPALPGGADALLSDQPRRVLGMVRRSFPSGQRSCRHRSRSLPASGTRTGRSPCRGAPPGERGRSCSSPVPAGCRSPAP